MATEQTPAKPEVDVNAVYEQAILDMSNRAYIPGFVEKLASDYGFQPQTKEELAELLQLASEIKAAIGGHQEKHASDRTTVIAEARAALSGQKKAEINEDLLAALTKESSLCSSAILYRDFVNQNS